MEKTQSFEQMAYAFWQGSTVPVAAIQAKVNELVQAILAAGPAMQAVGVAFPMEYVASAMDNTRMAFDTGDAYQMADILFHEWKEIETVYAEIMAELEQV